MHTYGKDQLITPWTVRKRVQEGDAQNQTNQKILMHLSQKNFTWILWKIKDDFAPNFGIVKVNDSEDTRLRRRLSVPVQKHTIWRNNPFKLMDQNFLAVFPHI